MDNPVESHKATAIDPIRCAVVTVSDTRTFETDTGGKCLADHLEPAGYVLVERQIVPDDPTVMRPLLESYRDNEAVDVVLMTGGTGITARDQTYETVCELLTKPLPGYGELFRLLSYEEIGPATILSRATGGLMQQTVLLTMPGSRAAVQLAMQKIIVPELGHLVREARR